MKKIALLFLFLLAPLAAHAQTTDLYRVATIAALKALNPLRPPIAVVMDTATGGEFTWGTTPCSAADDVFQVTPTAGPTGCWTRAANVNEVGKSATTNGVLVTSGTGVPSISTALPAVNASAATVIATGTVTARSLAARFATVFTPKDFGAVCDGSTNDAAPLQAWLDAVVATTTAVGFVDAYICASNVQIVSTGRDNLAIYGTGDGSVLKYIGASTTPGSLLKLGTGTARNGVIVQGIKIDSATTLTSGFGLEIVGTTDVQLDVLMGDQDTYKLYSGISINASATVWAGNSRTYTQAVGVRMNDCIEVYLNNMFIRGQTSGGHGTGYGVHVAGGCGGVYADQLSQLQNDIGFLVDNAVSATGNQQIFMGQARFDSNKNACAYFNDTNSNPIGKSIDWGTAWCASSTVGSGVVIANYAGGTFNAGGGTIKNNVGNGITLDDATVRVFLGTGLNISYNQAWGVGASGAISIYSTAVPNNNTSGTFQSTVIPRSPPLLLPGATSGTTSVISGAIAGTSVLTLPVATDTLVGKATTDALTNKSSITAPASSNLTLRAASGQTAVLGVTGGTSDLYVQSTGAFPSANNAMQLGDSALRWSIVNSVLGNFSGNVVAASVNGNIFTTGTGTLTLGAGKTFTASNTLTLTATDGSTLAIGAGGTLGSNAYTSTAYAPLASPTFTGTVTMPASVIIGGGGALTSSGLGGAIASSAFVNIGTSGATIPVLNAANTWSAAQGYSSTINMSFARSSGGPLNFIDTDSAGDTVQVGWGAGTGAQTFNFYKSTANTGAAVLLMSLSTAGAMVVTDTVRSNAGFNANGSAGLSATTTVRDSAGTGTCTLIFTFGIKTGGSC